MPVKQEVNFGTVKYKMNFRCEVCGKLDTVNLEVTLRFWIKM